VDKTVTEVGIEIYDDEGRLSVHYETTDVDKIVVSLASQWPHICELAAAKVSQLDIARPLRMVVLVRPDDGSLFFTLESDGAFVDEVANVTLQFIEDAFMDCEDDFAPVYHQLRDIARRSFAHASAASNLADLHLLIGIDDYQSVDPSTFELLNE